MSKPDFWWRVADIGWRLMLFGGSLYGLYRWAMMPDSLVQQLKAQGFWYIPIVVVLAFFLGTGLGWVLGNINGWERARRLNEKIEREMEA